MRKHQNIFLKKLDYLTKKTENRFMDALERVSKLKEDLERYHFKPRPFRVIIDPGHGGHDPGAVGGGTHESIEAYEFAQTLKYYLTMIPNVKVRLSRGKHYPTWLERTFLQGKADLALSIHLNSVKGGSLAFYPAGRDNNDGPDISRSRRFAEILDQCVDDPEFRVIPDNDKSWNRHGRLYIRNFRARTAVLWEVDPVHDMERPERIRRASQFLDATSRAMKAGIFKGWS